ncbi:MAG: pyruvate, phosphate dikinase [Spirochaetales bacterium]|nr:pyruvate, phosphate dikinase [Spirochaetales bacterium]
MKRNIHPFSQNKFSSEASVLKKIGIRGKQAMDFAKLDLPILPGFIIDAQIAAHLDEYKLDETLPNYFKDIETITKKKFNDPKNPLLVKIVVSPNLAIVHYPTLHNFGLTDNTIPGFNSFVGENFGYHEVLFLIKGSLEIELKIAELQNNKANTAKLTEAMSSLNRDMKTGKGFKTAVQKYKDLLPKGFFDDAYKQLSIILKRISLMLKLDELDDDDAALIIQPMVYGNYGKDSASGMFYTRNIVTGDDVLEGWFNQSEFDMIGSEGKDINKIEPAFHQVLKKIARKVEDHFKEIRSIRFTVENKKVWLIDQRPLMTKSTQADIRTLLDLYKRKIIDEKYLINAIKPEQLNEILHPVVNMDSVKKLPAYHGGISGAPGAAIGRVYFDTVRLLEAHKAAQHAGVDTRTILLMPATFAEDVKAIEVSSGVLSSEGGYSAHASVVARQYGKVSLVITDMQISGRKAKLGNLIINEGDLITLNVPQYGDPQVYIGRAELIEPDPEQSGLLQFIEIAKTAINDFHVRVNADKARDAAMALKFGAEGIGLCRTEHMFFDTERINVFREMIISDNDAKRQKALKKLKSMQQKDFYNIFKVMAGREVTIRLLDAPLHEFLPHNKAEADAFLAYLKKQGSDYASISQKQIDELIDALKEFNPMLGHRGCRIAVSYPEIYEMQIESIFEAAYQLDREGVKVHPEIMVPLIMNHDELKLIVYGKKIEGSTYKGLTQIEADLRKSLKARKIPYKIGTMIELPVAALGAGEIARYAEFFSFGTNDLTQTTIGLSRDDYTSFMPDYTLFDIIAGNPFKDLNVYVKELIEIAVRRGKLTRPNLVKGLCGEHGAQPDNIKFCIEAGLDYVSCSLYSIPIALLAIAQHQFKLADKASGED